MKTQYFAPYERRNSDISYVCVYIKLESQFKMIKLPIPYLILCGNKRIVYLSKHVITYKNILKQLKAEIVAFKCIYYTVVVRLK